MGAVRPTATIPAMSDAAAPVYKKRKAGGRPIDEKIWKHLKQIDLPSDKAEKAKRNHDAKCRHCGNFAVRKPYKMKENLSLSDQASNSDRIYGGSSMQIRNAASLQSLVLVCLQNSRPIEAAHDVRHAEVQTA